jgi:hypothetical protein
MATNDSDGGVLPSWENMTKPERTLYLQAEKEFETGTVSAKILDRANQEIGGGSGEEGELERHYVRLRYWQLRGQCVTQQKKIAERHARQNVSRVAIGGSDEQAGGNQDPLGKTILWTVIFLASLAVLAAIAIGVVSLIG